jgi:hypothetical protein
MSHRIKTAGAAIVALALLPAATFAATPNRTGTLADEGAKYTWTSDVATGFVYGAPVAPKAPHCTPIFSCDYTLVKTEKYGDLQVDIAGQGIGGQDTLKDIDLHVYASDATGATTDGPLAESTGATATESVVLPDADPGYYLVEVDWYLGVGSFDGTATLLAPTPPDPEA